jgi:hypothetical protein
MQRRAWRLLHGHRGRHHAGQVRCRHIHAVLIKARVVVGGIFDAVEQINARGQAIHGRLCIKLGHRQIAGFRRIASADPDELADRGQSAAQDGNCENHLQ